MRFGASRTDGGGRSDYDVPVRVLLIRPDPGNERFGLGPFFRVEPLGLAYLGAALRASGTSTTIVDERFERVGGSRIRRLRPDVVGISCMHALEYDRALETARAVRRLAPGAFTIVGGHAAAAFPEALEHPEVDAICVDDGEAIVPALVAALARGRPVDSVPGLRVRADHGWLRSPDVHERPSLDLVPLPDRSLVERYRGRYHCLLFKPVWLVETARGCPFRCTFCSVWEHYDRTYRLRSIGAVTRDMASVGPHVFIADDLFWNHPERSLELARALRAAGVHKRWILVQSRTDVVRRHPELLEAWRPLAQEFDIFMGLEASTDAKLRDVSKDATVGDTLEAVQTARALRYGVTGNFLVDPDWGEEDFRQLWEFVAEHRLERAGYTILTPLPGTELHERLRPRLAGQPWYKYDMHHVLWEPRLGAPRFFELYAETWRRSMLNLGGGSAGGIGRGRSGRARFRI